MQIMRRLLVLRKASKHISKESGYLTVAIDIRLVGTVLHAILELEPHEGWSVHN
jgi:hypothetical protein